MTEEEAEWVKGKNDELLRAYKVCFAGPAGQMVLANLSAFCRMTSTTHALGDPYTSALFEGRRQVFLRIIQAVKLTEEEILQISLRRIQTKIGGDE